MSILTLSASAATLGSLEEAERGARPGTAEAKSLKLNCLGKKVAESWFSSVSSVGATEQLAAGWLL